MTWELALLIAVLLFGLWTLWPRMPPERSRIDYERWGLTSNSPGCRGDPGPIATETIHRSAGFGTEAERR